MKSNLDILLMKRIVFLFSIVLMLCSCKSFEDHSNEKAVGTYKNGYILNLNKEIVATYRNGYVFSEKALGTPNDYGLGLEQDIYTTGKIDTLMLKSKYFDFKRKVFVYLPPFYPYFDANDFDVVYTTDAQTMEQFFMTCAWPLFQNKYKWFIVVGTFFKIVGIVVSCTYTELAVVRNGTGKIKVCIIIVCFLHFGKFIVGHALIDNHAIKRFLITVLVGFDTNILHGVHIEFLSLESGQSQHLHIAVLQTFAFCATHDETLCSIVAPRCLIIEFAWDVTMVETDKPTV